MDIAIAQPDDKVDILHLADRQLGAGYLDPQLLCELLDSSGGFTLVAKRETRVVGFAMCLILDADEARRMTRTEVPNLGHADCIGIVKTVAVSPDSAGMGIGTDLVRACLDRFRAVGVRAAMSIAWKKGNVVNIRGVLTTCGFREFATVEDFWAEESLEEGFDCPACATPPCRCSAVMFARLLGRGDSGRPAPNGRACGQAKGCAGEEP